MSMHMSIHICKMLAYVGRVLLGGRQQNRVESVNAFMMGPVAVSTWVCSCAYIGINVCMIGSDK